MPDRSEQPAPYVQDNPDEPDAAMASGVEGALTHIAALWPDLNSWGERVIMEGGEAVGYLSVREIDQGMLWIGEICLEPGREKQGIGSALLDRICETADRFGCNIGLEALWRPDTSDGGWLARWYESRGFKPDSEPDQDHLVTFLRPPAPACEPEHDMPPAP